MEKSLYAMQACYFSGVATSKVCGYYLNGFPAQAGILFETSDGLRDLFRFVVCGY
jgi:hypothetical protein